MKPTVKRKEGECIIEKKIVNGRRTFKCKNVKRAPTIQEIIDSVDYKIKYK